MELEREGMQQELLELDSLRLAHDKLQADIQHLKNVRSLPLSLLFSPPVSSLPLSPASLLKLPLNPFRILFSASSRA